MTNNSMQRVLSGVVMASLAWFFLYIRGPWVIVLALAFAVPSVLELSRAYRNAGYNPMTNLGIVMTLLILGAYTFYDIHNFKIALIVVFLMFFMVMAYHVFTKHEAIDVMITIFSIIYIVFPIALIVELSKRPDNYMWLPFQLAISTDLFAYFVGKTMGKHKLIEAVSPKKTVEGAIGGVVGCILSSFVFAYLWLPQISYFDMLLLAFIGSIASQVGDLTASKIKRYCKIKDFGDIIPGHGGALDRLDSILFTALIVFVYVWFHN